MTAPASPSRRPAPRVGSGDDEARSPSASLRADGGTLPSSNEFLLAAMRCGRVRISLLLTEMDQIGVALKSNLVDHDGAITWLDECGLLQFIDVKVEPKDAAA